MKTYSIDIDKLKLKLKPYVDCGCWILAGAVLYSTWTEESRHRDIMEYNKLLHDEIYEANNNLYHRKLELEKLIANQRNEGPAHEKGKGE